MELTRLSIRAGTRQTHPSGIGNHLGAVLQVQSLKDLEDLTDAVLFHVGDTTVTAAVGKVVFKTSDGTFYGCVRATPTTRWEAFN